MSAADRVAPFRRVAIVGFGLIGGSLGLATKKQWPQTIVIAIDRPEVVCAGTAMGAADVGGDDLALAGDADLIVLAAPIHSNIRTIREIGARVPGTAVVTDVGSTKRETVRAAADALPPRLQFIGGHPVAGAAVSGVGAARADLFEGRPWILTPDGSGEPGIRNLTGWIEALGATVHRLTPESHDRLVSVLSHLPQITASALMQVVGNCSGPEGLALAGPGLRDTTRLASSGASIWRDIARTNQDNIGTAIEALVSVLVDIKADLAGGNAALVRTFDAAAAWRTTLEGHVSEKGPGILVTRRYLEMRARSELRPAAPSGPEVRVERLHDCPPAFWRFLYKEVGRRYQWIDRLSWTEDQIRAYLADPATSLWLMSVSGAPAGYFELRRHDDDSVEIAYFGLLEPYLGRGLGGHLLTFATERAWDLDPARVWMHTNTLDHPAALPNYLKRGFVVFRTEEYVVESPNPDGRVQDTPRYNPKE